VRHDAIAWERAAEVRTAARGWLRAGAIDESTHQAIEKMYADPCITPSVVWRVLTAGIVSAVILCALGAIFVPTRPRSTGLALLLVLFGGACLVATERLNAAPPLARRGAAGATSFWGLLLILVGVGVLLQESLKLRVADALDAVLLSAALAWGAGCWRWGNPIFAGLSAVSLFLFLGRLPHGRFLWILASAALTVLAARRLDARGWAPSHRRAATVLVVAGILAGYVALNVYSLDEHLLEELRRLDPGRLAQPPGRALFFVSAVATAVLPVVILGWAWMSRRAFLLDAGIVLLALSLVTLRHYVQVAPLWAALAGSGAALIALALVVERVLRRSPGGELAGFTSDPLFSDDRRQRFLEIVPVAATLAPAPPPGAPEKSFVGRGGGFGGGGASERF
jgi:hypothetical protein